MLRTTLAQEEVAVRNAVDNLLSRPLQQQEDCQLMSYDQEKTLEALLQTPRRRFLFLEAGGVRALVELLRAHGLDRPILVSLLSIMRLLILCCQDTESAVGVGMFGLHPWIKRVLTSNNQEEGQEDDEAREALREYAEEIASRCARVRGGFPLQRLALCSESALSSLHLPVRVPIYSRSRTTHAQNSQPPKKNENEELTVLVSPIAHRMSSQADTGYFLWPAATILTRFILRNSSLFSGRRVMEIGAGLGLCGLVTVRVAKEVLLTDHNLACLQQMQEHVGLNCDDGRRGGEEQRVVPKEGEVAAEAGAAGAAVGAIVALVRPGTIKVRWLDWNRLEAVSTSTWQVSEEAEEEEGEQGKQEGKEEAKSEVDEKESGEGSDGGRCLSKEETETFGRPRWSSGLLDVVIGSDCICDEPSAVGVARLLSLTLKPGTGVGYILAPAPQHRYGIHALPRELEARGLAFEQEEVIDEELLEGLQEAAYMRFHLFTVRRKQVEGQQGEGAAVAVVVGATAAAVAAAAAVAVAATTTAATAVATAAAAAAAAAAATTAAATAAATAATATATAVAVAGGVVGAAAAAAAVTEGAVGSTIMPSVGSIDLTKEM